MFPPEPSRRIKGVLYTVANIENDDLVPSMASARVDIVIHRAGTVDLTSDSTIKYSSLITKIHTTYPHRIPFRI